MPSYQKMLIGFVIANILAAVGASGALRPSRVDAQASAAVSASENSRGVR